MDWIRRDQYHFESDNGKYRITIAYARKDCVYTAWRREVQQGEVVWSSILYSQCLSHAQRACEKVLNARSQRVANIACEVGE
jgi:hypothetical protein